MNLLRRCLHVKQILLFFSLIKLLPQVEAAPPDILFVGNSFTMGETASVPTIFDRLAIAGGNEDPNTIMRAAPGRNFQFHETDATSQAAIASRPWSYVILQNYSTEPTHIGNVAHHLLYGEQLHRRILANHPSSQVVLFQTWSRSARHPLISGTSSHLSFQSTTQMQAELRENYQRLASSLNHSFPLAPIVTVAPVGDAWENAGGLHAESDPFFTDLHGNDEYHGNDNGYYLAAATIYATIYQKSPEGLSLHQAVRSLNLRLTVPAGKLERTAWDTVTRNLSVQFITQPQSTTVPENQPATFTASVHDSIPYLAQWYRNGELIPGATELTLTLPRTTTDLDGATFTLRISNFASSQESTPATLKVITSHTPIPQLTSTTTVTLAFPVPLSPQVTLQPSLFNVIYQGLLIPITSLSLSSDGKHLTLHLDRPIGPGFTVKLPDHFTDATGTPFSSNPLVTSPRNSSPSLKLLIDFGSSEFPTLAADDTAQTWNNLTPAIGTSDTAVLQPLLNPSGQPTTARLEMIRRFNGANTSGQTLTPGLPGSASRDSLFGNTESFVNLSHIFPAFRLSGLDPLTPYTLTFFASRTDVSDNRSTTYHLTGQQTHAISLNPSNNIATTASITHVYPSPGGDITIALSPSPENNNTYHFTYLGTLVLTDPSTSAPSLHPPVIVHQQAILDWTGNGQLESFSADSPTWTPFSPTPTPPFITPASPSARLFRLSYPTP